uniref:Nuclear localized protein 1 n=1 Tax=Nicotiana benthamiana TaxID=4100 RepID=E1AWW8_NICBE|nr:nuclear localized protein 1 [Nicotiana benthamiana]
MGALDVDDSDLHSLLRPCKRLNHNCNLYTSTSNSPPLLPPSSQSSESSQLQTSQHQLQSPPQCLIPGPAGSVQAAMVQRTYDRQSHSLMTSQGDNLIPTQEYIGRAVENSSDFDYDFQSKLWRYANDVFGKENGIPSTPLSSVNKCQKASRVDRVVAVVKSCTHNGLGGLMVTLKDRTGSIGASIHHKVLSENQYGKDICIGSVLILQKVAVFCPSTSSSSYYLNITLRNLIKVFCKESGPPSMHSLAAYEVNHSDPEIAASASARKASALQKISIPDKETTEEIIDVRTTEYMSAGGNLHKEVQMRKENLVPSSYICNKIRASNVTSIVDKECHNQLQSAAKGFEGTDRNRGTLHENNNQQMGENFLGSLSPGNKRAGSIKNRFDPEIQIVDEVKDYKQPIVSKVPQLQWTDEQLDELFACEDDECSLL